MPHLDPAGRKRSPRAEYVRKCALALARAPARGTKTGASGAGDGESRRRALFLPLSISIRVRPGNFSRARAKVRGTRHSRGHSKLFPKRPGSFLSSAGAGREDLGSLKTSEAALCRGIGERQVAGPRAGGI